MDKGDVAEKMKQMRSLERKAKQLLYKMDRLQDEWNEIKEALKKSGKPISHQLGDVLSGWQNKSR